MAYSEIINEIEEQITELQAKHSAKLAEMAELQTELPALQAQIAELVDLKSRAESLGQPAAAPVAEEEQNDEEGTGIS